MAEKKYESVQDIEDFFKSEVGLVSGGGSSASEKFLRALCVYLYDLKNTFFDSVVRETNINTMQTYTSLISLANSLNIPISFQSPLQFKCLLYRGEVLAESKYIVEDVFDEGKVFFLKKGSIVEVAGLSWVVSVDQSGGYADYSTWRIKDKAGKYVSRLVKDLKDTNVAGVVGDVFRMEEVGVYPLTLSLVEKKLKSGVEIIGRNNRLFIDNLDTVTNVSNLVYAIDLEFDENIVGEGLTLLVRHRTTKKEYVFTQLSTGRYFNSNDFTFFTTLDIYGNKLLILNPYVFSSVGVLGRHYTEDILKSTYPLKEFEADISYYVSVESGVEEKIFFDFVNEKSENKKIPVTVLEDSSEYFLYLEDVMFYRGRSRGQSLEDIRESIVSTMKSRGSVTTKQDFESFLKGSGLVESVRVYGDFDRYIRAVKHEGIGVVPVDSGNRVFIEALEKRKIKDVGSSILREVVLPVSTGTQDTIRKKLRSLTSVLDFVVFVNTDFVVLNLKCTLFVLKDFSYEEKKEIDKKVLSVLNVFLDNKPIDSVFHSSELTDVVLGVEEVVGLHIERLGMAKYMDFPIDYYYDVGGREVLQGFTSVDCNVYNPIQKLISLDVADYYFEKVGSDGKKTKEYGVVDGGRKYGMWVNLLDMSAMVGDNARLIGDGFISVPFITNVGGEVGKSLLQVDAVKVSVECALDTGIFFFAKKQLPLLRTSDKIPLEGIPFSVKKDAGGGDAEGSVNKYLQKIGFLEKLGAGSSVEDYEVGRMLRVVVELDFEKKGLRKIGNGFFRNVFTTYVRMG